MTYNSTVLTDAPKHYVTFDQTGTYTDSGSQNSSLTVFGSPVAATGISGKGLTYNGTTDYVYINSPFDFGASSAFTFECWFKSTATTNYPTFIRRDGNGVAYLMRLNMGKVEFYCGTPGIVSTNSYADGKWHHVVGVKNGSSTTLYVDGVSVGTGSAVTTAQNSGAQAIHVGENSGSEMFVGTLDEVAIYGTALSAAQVTAHYNAGTPSPNVTVIPPAAAVSMAAPAPVVTAIDAYFTHLVATKMSTTQDDSGNGTVYRWNTGIGPELRILLPDLSHPSGVTAKVSSSQLSVYATPYGTTGSVTYQIYRYTQVFGAGTKVATSITGTHSGNGLSTIDITSLVQGWYDGSYPNYGIALVATGSTGALKVYTSNMPYMDTHLAEIPVTNVSVTPATLSISIPAVTTSVSSNVTVMAPVSTMSLTSVDPNVTAVAPNTTVSATAAAMSIAAPDVLVFSPTNVTAVVTGAGSMTIEGQDVAIDMDTQRTILVDNAMGMTIRTVGILNTEQDRYFKAVRGTVDFDDVWLKLDEASGTVANHSTVPDANGATWNIDGTYYGNPLLDIEGPQLHKAVHFDGIDDSVGGLHGLYYKPSLHTFMDVTVEFSIKTTQNNGTLIQGDGMQAVDGVNGQTFGTGYPGSEIRLIDGQLALYNGNTNKNTWIVHRNIADGQWHHIVVSLPSVSTGTILPGTLRVHPYFVAIDGVVEWTRFNAQINGAAFLPSNAMVGIEGDFSNLVVRTNYAVSPDTATKLYYEWSNTTLAQAGAMSASINAVNPAKAGGNVKKMMALYGLPLWYGTMGTRDGFGNYYSVFAGFYIFNDQFEIPTENGTKSWAGLPYVSASNVFPMRYVKPKPFMINEYMVYPVAIMKQPGATGPYSADGMENGNNIDPVDGIYYDDRTGLPRFVDINEDLAVDVTDYDILTVVNYPATTPEDPIDGGGSSDFLREPRQHSMGLSKSEWQSARDKLRDSILDAAYRGVNLWIAEPEMATHLGFIQGYVKHDPASRIEFGGPGGVDPTGFTNVQGLKVDQAHMTSPDAAARLATGLRQGVGQYNFTWQANAKRKIVNVETGLTDLPSWELSEMIHYNRTNAFDVYNDVVAYDVMDRTNGLQVGDLPLMSMLENNQASSSSADGFPGALQAPWSINSPRRYIIAATPNGIAGKIISVEMDSYYGINGVVVANPYKGYVYTIAAERGTIVNGRAIAGRAFIEFMSAEWNNYVTVDFDERAWHGGTGPTPQSTWDYDTRRQREFITTMTMTTYSIFGLTFSGFQKENVSINKEDFPILTVDTSGNTFENRPHVSMQARGLHWLSLVEKPNNGDAKVFVGAANVAIEVKAPVATPSRNNVITVPAARMDIEARTPQNYRGGDVIERVLPAEMFIQSGGLGKVIGVTPATIEISAPPVIARGGGDTVFVYMDADISITLFMKEDS